MKFKISLLINIALSQDVPFYRLQQLQCLHHGATFVLLCAPIQFVAVASVRDTKTESIAEALLHIIFCL